MATYKLISSLTVGSGGTSSIQFTSIPNTYTDLLLKLSLRSTNSAGWNNAPIRLQFNSETGGYSNLTIRGNGSSVSSSSNDYAGTSRMFVGEGAATPSGSSMFGNAEVYIPNYTWDKNKSVSVESIRALDGGNADLNITAGLLTANSAITSITIETYTPNSGWTEYSTAYLYGINN